MRECNFLEDTACSMWQYYECNFIDQVQAFRLLLCDAIAASARNTNVHSLSAKTDTDALLSSAYRWPHHMLQPYSNIIDIYLARTTRTLCWFCPRTVLCTGSRCR